jgi:hypothetical protein
MRAVYMVSRAPETQYRELAVELLIHCLPRVDKQRGGLLLLQVAAGMRVGRIDLEIPYG